MTTAVVVALAIVSVLLLVPPRPGVETPRGPEPAPPRREVALLARLRPVLVLVAALGGWSLVGGPAGWVVGAGCALTVWVVLGRTEDPAVVRRREQLARDLPTAVDLLAACLDAGAAPEPALRSVARALGGPVAEELLALHHRLLVGVDPGEVWRGVAAHPQLGPLGRAVGRAHESGAPVSAAVGRLAEDLRARARAEVEARARSIEVKAAAPLGLCLLPAFVLLGVVPMVAGVLGSLRPFG